MTAQLHRRCLVTENVADFVLVEAAWRSKHASPHDGLILVAPEVFPRHRSRAVGQRVRALAEAAATGAPEPGMVVRLQPAGD